MLLSRIFLTCFRQIHTEVFRPIFAYANKNVYLCIAGVMAHNGQPLTITIDVGLVRMVFDGAENVPGEKAEHATKIN